MIFPYQPRWISTSLQFSESSFINCGSPSVLASLSSFTLEAWIYPSTNVGPQTIVGNGSPSQGQCQLFLNAAGIPSVFVGIAPYVLSASTNSPYYFVTSAWNHVAATFDAPSGTLTLYVNGNEAAQGSFVGTVPAAQSQFMIGASGPASAPTNFFQGQIGRVSVWGTARQAEDILNDSVQSEVYQPVETPDLLFNADFSSMPPLDSSGNAAVLQCQSVQCIQSTPAVQFPGSSGAVDCGNQPGFSFPFTASYTIEGWFSPSSSGPGTLVSYGDQAGSWEYRVLYQNNTVVGSRNSDGLQVTSVAAVVPGSYYHFALTYDQATQALSLYVNGNLQAVQYFASPVAGVADGHFLIGAQYPGNSTAQYANGFSGMMQSLRLWNVCLEEAEIYQWMYNEVVTDSRLVMGCDFSANPPVDTANYATINFYNGAVPVLPRTVLPMTDPQVLLGLPQNVNAEYFNDADAVPDPVPAVQFAEQPSPFSDTWREKNWSDFLAFHHLDAAQEEGGKRRARFEASFAEARRRVEADPRQARAFTRIDENGTTRIIHHGPRRDTVIYERPTGTDTACTLWWLQFVYQVTVGFFGALGLVPTTGDIATRIYNLIIGNRLANQAIQNLASGTITVATGCAFLGTLWQAGLLWGIMKMILTSAGWYTLFWVFKKAIGLVTGLEAATLLAGFIVWAAQLVNIAIQYSANCSPNGSGDTSCRIAS